MSEPPSSLRLASLEASGLPTTAASPISPLFAPLLLPLTVMPLPPLFATPLVSAPELLSPLLPLAPVPPAPLGAAPLLPLPELAFPLCATPLGAGPEDPHPSAGDTSNPLTMQKGIPAVEQAPNRRERNAGRYTPSRPRAKLEGANAHHADIGNGLPGFARR